MNLQIAVRLNAALFGGLTNLEQLSQRRTNRLKLVVWKLTHLMGQPPRFPQPQLGKHDTLLPFLEVNTMVVQLILDLCRERDAPENPAIKLMDNQHRTAELRAFAIFLVTDIHADAAPPNIPLVGIG